MTHNWKGKCLEEKTNLDAKLPIRKFLKDQPNKVLLLLCVMMSSQRQGYDHSKKQTVL